MDTLSMEEYIDIFSEEFGETPSIIEEILLELYEESPYEGHGEFLEETFYQELAIDISFRLDIIKKLQGERQVSSRTHNPMYAGSNPVFATTSQGGAVGSSLGS